MRTVWPTLFSLGVCGLRLDFDSFTIRGPGDTKETDGGECKDTFKISVSIIKFVYGYQIRLIFHYLMQIFFLPQSTDSQNIPTICGKNTGQHGK